MIDMKITTDLYLGDCLIELKKIPKIGMIMLSTNGTVFLKDEKIYELDLNIPKYIKEAIIWACK